MRSERIQRRVDRLLDQTEQAADQRDWAEPQQIVARVLVLDRDGEDAKQFAELAVRVAGTSAPAADEVAPTFSPVPTAPLHPERFGVARRCEAASSRGRVMRPAGAVPRDGGRSAW